MVADSWLGRGAGGVHLGSRSIYVDTRRHLLKLARMDMAVVCGDVIWESGGVAERRFKRVVCCLVASCDSSVCTTGCGCSLCCPGTKDL